MGFDRDAAQRTVVEILDGVKSDRTVGIGFRLLDDVVATACRCLPHAGGKVRLPDPDRPAEDPVLVRVRDPATGKTAVAAVLAADPCSDYALLGAPAGRAPGAEDALRPDLSLQELAAGGERAALQLAPPPEGVVFIFTHEKRWVQAVARGASLSFPSAAHRVRGATSGAPAFDAQGRVVGLVGFNDIRLADAALCVLADQLPGWALRRAGAARSAALTISQANER
jgi:hypothetical protein